MSRRTGSHPHRPLVAAGLLALVGLATSATATHAQSINPERALLNPTPAVSYRSVSDTPGPWGTIDGDRVLLGRSAGVSAAPSLAAQSHGDVLIVDGEQALLGQVGPSRRRLTLAW